MNRTIHRAIAVLAVTSASIALTACASPGNQNSDNTGTLKIAAVVGITGLMASFDGPPVKAAQLAVDDINADGGIDGRKVELITIDTQTDVNQAGPAVQRAIDQGAELILAPCDFDSGAPVALAAQAAGLVAISDCAGAPAFGVQGIGPLAFTMGLAAPSEGAALAEWAYNEKGYRSAYVMLDTTLEYHKQVCSGFTDRWEELGGKVSGSDTFKNADSSIATQISDLEASASDVLMYCSFPPGGASGLRQIRSAGIDLPILSPQSFDGEYWKDAIPDLSNFFYTSYGSLNGDNQDTALNDLIKRYVEETGETPANANIVTGYSVIQAFKAAVEKAGTTEGTKVAVALESFKDEPLLIGPTTFSQDLHIDLTRPMLLMQIVDGVSSSLKTITLAKPPTVKF